MSESQTRDRILDAALRVLARDGAAAGSLRRIGAEAGLHNSSLFHHFPGKDALHDALAGRVIGAAAPSLASLATDARPRLASLADALGDLAEHLAVRPDHASFLLSALAAGGCEALDGARSRAESELLAPIWQWLVRARDAGEIRRVRPQPTTLQLMGLVLLEPAWSIATGPSVLRPASSARRRELEAWVRGALGR